MEHDNREFVEQAVVGQLYFARGVELFAGEIYGECEKVNNNSVQLMILKMGTARDRPLAIERGFRTIVPKKCLYREKRP